MSWRHRGQSDVARLPTTGQVPSGPVPGSLATAGKLAVWLTGGQRGASRAGWRRGRARKTSRSNPHQRSQPSGQPPPPKGPSGRATCGPPPCAARRSTPPPSACLAPDDRSEVASRQAHRPRHVLERDTLAVAILDEAEDLGEQGLVLEPEISHHVRRQPRDAHEQERQVRKDRLPVAVSSLAELEIEGRQVLGPGGPLCGRNLQVLGSSRCAPNEGEQ